MLRTRKLKSPVKERVGPGFTCPATDWESQCEQLETIAELQVSGAKIG